MKHYLSMEDILDSSDVVSLLQRVKGVCSQKLSHQSLEKVCADMAVLWGALSCPGLDVDGARREFFSLWSTFLGESVAHLANESPLSCFRSLLEALVAAAASEVVLEASIIEINDAHVDQITCALAAKVYWQTVSRSSLTPPLDVMQEVAGLIELLQEYYLIRHGSIKTYPDSLKKLMEGHNAMFERYTAVFVGEVTFPSYWNMNWQTSSRFALIDGVHPSIYFCFTTLVNLVQRWKRCSGAADDRPCRQLVARLLEGSALAILSVAGEKEMDDTRKQQIELDVAHFVLFSRMFRSFVGEGLFSVVSAHLVSLLEGVAKRIGAGAVFKSPNGLSSFEEHIWNVPPITESEWISLASDGGNGSMHVFTPWSTVFIRASHVKAAQTLPKGWMAFSFQHLL